MRLHWPWTKDKKHDDETPPTEADLARENSEEQLISAHTRWPEVLRLRIDVDAERSKNHFAERWERELRANARGD